MRCIRSLLIAFSILSVVVAAGCTRVKYGDPTDVEVVTTEFGSTDLQLIANKMVDSMLAFPPLIELTADERPVIAVDRIKNKTTEHIDTESVTDSIINKIIHSGRFRFVDIANMDVLEAQLVLQTETDVFDPATTARLGRLIGSDYLLYGNLSSIVKQTKKVEDVYYKFTLRLTHLETGIIEWQDEQEIRKTQKRSWFGG